MADRTIIMDLGIGNLSNVQKVVGGRITCKPGDIERADKIVLPGVGNFGDVMESLEPISGHIRDAASEGKYILGICLGMHLFFRSSEEGRGSGLDLIPGEVSRLRGVRIPHIGWNRVMIAKDSPLFEGIEDGSYFYFVHSYHPVPEKKEHVACTTRYGEPGDELEFVSAVRKDNVFGVQFHPEKSSLNGLKLLNNFREL